jgi:hypothetical protein
MSDTFDHEGDAWDSLLFGQDADGEYISWDSRDAHRIVSWSSYKAPQPKTCRACGQRGLYWGQTDRGWRLFNFGREHVCGNVAATTLLRKLVANAS